MRACTHPLFAGAYLWPLRRHQIGSLEVAPRVIQQLPIARMIDGFHGRQILDHFGMMAVEMLHEFRFRVRGPGHEKGLRASDRRRDIFEEGMILGGMSAAHRICLVMDMGVGIVWMKHKLIGLQSVEMEDTGLAMVDPQNCVRVRAHGLVFRCERPAGQFHPR
jgi:hypothetical protein